MLKKAFGGPLIANEMMDKESGTRLLQEGSADAISFGRAYIANPDLHLRLQQEKALNPLDEQTLYFGGPKGYVDYPFLGPCSKIGPDCV